MTIWYFDPDGGNNSNDGQSFANRKQVNEYSSRSMFNDGDEIRFIKSPDPTSLGNATWTADAAQYLEGTMNEWKNHSSSGRDIISVSFTGNSAPNPTSCVKTGHGLATGDTILIPDTAYETAGAFEITVTDADNFTLDGTENTPAFSTKSLSVWTASPYRVLLATACTKNIICYQSEGGIGDKDWTATLGTTGRETTVYQSGYKGARYFKPGTSGTGKAAYVELENALDLSGYQQISFRVNFDYMISSQEDDDSIMSLRLCTDTTGDTSVHTIPITHGFDNADDWYSVVHDFGTNLNSSIQSVAIYVDTQMAHASNEVIIDNVIACKAKSSADSLTHASLISKGNTHDDEWYPILAIDGKRIFLKSGGDTDGGVFDVYNCPYSGTTETVTTYKRECFRRPTFYSTQQSKYSPFFNIYESVQMTQNNITISGGWNTTDMSTQDTNAGTWFDVVQPRNFAGLYLITTNHLTVSNFGIVNGWISVSFNTSYYGGGRYNTFNNVHSISPNYHPDSTPESTWNNCNFIRSTFYGDDEYGNYNSEVVFKDCKIIDGGISQGSANINRKYIFLNPTIRGQYRHALTGWIQFCPQAVTILGGTINNVRSILQQGVNYFMRRNADVKIIHTQINNASIAPVNSAVFLDADEGSESGDDTPVSFINYNNTANDHRLYFYGALVTSETSIRNTASGIAWKMQINNTDYDNYRHPTKNPVRWKIAETAVNASAQVTVTAYVRRSNTDFGIKLAVLARDNYHLGVTSDTSVTASGSVDTWEQITLNFTPNAAGVATIRCLFGAVGNTAYAGYIDDIAITQA